MQQQRSGLMWLTQSNTVERSSHSSWHRFAYHCVHIAATAERLWSKSFIASIDQQYLSENRNDRVRHYSLHRWQLRSNQAADINKAARTVGQRTPPDPESADASYPSHKAP
jgi:hypothetical protein